MDAGPRALTMETARHIGLYPTTGIEDLVRFVLANLRSGLRWCIQCPAVMQPYVHAVPWTASGSLPPSSQRAEQFEDMLDFQSQFSSWEKCRR
jgi:hypothetical protein